MKSKFQKFFLTVFIALSAIFFLAGCAENHYYHRYHHHTRGWYDNHHRRPPQGVNFDIDVR